MKEWAFRLSPGELNFFPTSFSVFTEARMSPDFHIVWIFTIDIFHILHVPFLIPGQSPDMMGLQGFSVFRMIWKTLLTFLFQQWHPQPQPQPYPYLFKTQSSVPKFHKNMSVNIWIQNAKV